MEEDKTFYKYLPFNRRNVSHIRDIFINNRIYFSSPTEFNDPFDGKYQYSLEGTKEEKRKYLIRVLKSRSDLSPAKRIQEATRRVDRGDFERINSTTNVMQEVGVYCLSLVKNDILMWAHYSQKHEGLVLEFKAGAFFGRAFPVKYRAKYPNVRIYDDHVKRLEAGILTKSEHWSYEKEYRIIEYPGGAGLYEFPGYLLTGVIFGYRMPENRKSQIKKWISSLQFKPAIYQSSLKEREYGLNIELVN